MTKQPRTRQPSTRSNVSTELLELFLQCAESASITAAAQKMKLSPSLAARKLARLERLLAARLFHRSTRRIELTEAGRYVVAWARQALGGYDALRDELAALTERPAGVIRFAANHFGAEHLAPRALAEFLVEHPGINVSISTSDDMRDVIADRFDVAVYSGILPDSGLVGVRVAEYRRITCAAPDYVERHGSPTHPSDLARFACLTHARIEPRNWYFRHDGGLIKQPVHSRAESDNNAVLLELARKGLGIACLPDFMLRQDLRDGRLVQLLPGYEAVYANGERPALWIVYPDRHLLYRTRLFIDFIHRAIHRVASDA